MVKLHGHMVCQGPIQDFMIVGSKLRWGFDLLIVPDYLLFFLIVLKFPSENELILSQSGVRTHETPLDPPLVCSPFLSRAYFIKTWN